MFHWLKIEKKVNILKLFQSDEKWKYKFEQWKKPEGQLNWPVVMTHWWVIWNESLNFGNLKSADWGGSDKVSGKSWPWISIFTRLTLVIEFSEFSKMLFHDFQIPPSWGEVFTVKPWRPSEILFWRFSTSDECFYNQIRYVWPEATSKYWDRDWIWTSERRLLIG